MVRQIVITIPSEYADVIVEPLSKLNIVHHLCVYNGKNNLNELITKITCKVVNKKTDEILKWCSRYGIGTSAPVPKGGDFANTLEINKQNRIPTKAILLFIV